MPTWPGQGNSLGHHAPAEGPLHRRELSIPSAATAAAARPGAKTPAPSRRSYPWSSPWSIAAWAEDRSGSPRPLGDSLAARHCRLTSCLERWAFAAPARSGGSRGGPRGPAWVVLPGSAGAGAATCDRLSGRRRVAEGAEPVARPAGIGQNALLNSSSSSSNRTASAGSGASEGIMTVAASDQPGPHLPLVAEALPPGLTRRQLRVERWKAEQRRKAAKLAALVREQQHQQQHGQGCQDGEQQQELSGPSGALGEPTASDLRQRLAVRRAETAVRRAIRRLVGFCARVEGADKQQQHGEGEEEGVRRLEPGSTLRRRPAEGMLAGPPPSSPLRTEDDTPAAAADEAGCGQVSEHVSLGIGPTASPPLPRTSSLPPGPEAASSSPSLHPTGAAVPAKLEKFFQAAGQAALSYMSLSSAQELAVSSGGAAQRISPGQPPADPCGGGSAGAAGTAAASPAAAAWLSRSARAQEARAAARALRPLLSPAQWRLVLRVTAAAAWQPSFRGAEALLLLLRTDTDTDLATTTTDVEAGSGVTAPAVARTGDRGALGTTTATTTAAAAAAAAVAPVAVPYDRVAGEEPQLEEVVAGLRRLVVCQPPNSPLRRVGGGRFLQRLQLRAEASGGAAGGGGAEGVGAGGPAAAAAAGAVTGPGLPTRSSGGGGGAGSTGSSSSRSLSATAATAKPNGRTAGDVEASPDVMVSGPEVARPHSPLSPGPGGPARGGSAAGGHEHRLQPGRQTVEGPRAPAGSGLDPGGRGAVREGEEMPAVLPSQSGSRPAAPFPAPPAPPPPPPPPPPLLPAGAWCEAAGARALAHRLRQQGRRPGQQAAAQQQQQLVGGGGDLLERRPPQTSAPPADPVSLQGGRGQPQLQDSPYHQPLQLLAQPLHDHQPQQRYTSTPAPASGMGASPVAAWSPHAACTPAAVVGSGGGRGGGGDGVASTVAAPPTAAQPLPPADARWLLAFYHGTLPGPPHRDTPRRPTAAQPASRPGLAEAAETRANVEAGQSSRGAAQPSLEPSLEQLATAIWALDTLYPRGTWWMDVPLPAEALTSISSTTGRTTTPTATASGSSSSGGGGPPPGRVRQEATTTTMGSASSSSTTTTTNVLCAGSSSRHGSSAGPGPRGDPPRPSTGGVSTHTSASWHERWMGWWWAASARGAAALAARAAADGGVKPPGDVGRGSRQGADEEDALLMLMEVIELVAVARDPLNDSQSPQPSQQSQVQHPYDNHIRGTDSDGAGDADAGLSYAHPLLRPPPYWRDSVAAAVEAVLLGAVEEEEGEEQQEEGREAATGGTTREALSSPKSPPSHSSSFPPPPASSSSSSLPSSLSSSLSAAAATAAQARAAAVFRRRLGLLEGYLALGLQRHRPRLQLAAGVVQSYCQVGGDLAALPPGDLAALMRAFREMGTPLGSRDTAAAVAKALVTALHRSPTLPHPAPLPLPLLSDCLRGLATHDLPLPRPLAADLAAALTARLRHTTTGPPASTSGAPGAAAKGPIGGSDGGSGVTGGSGGGGGAGVSSGLPPSPSSPPVAALIRSQIDRQRRHVRLVPPSHDWSSSKDHPQAQPQPHPHIQLASSSFSSFSSSSFPSASSSSSSSLQAVPAIVAALGRMVTRHGAGRGEGEGKRGRGPRKAAAAAAMAQEKGAEEEEDQENVFKAPLDACLSVLRVWLRSCTTMELLTAGRMLLATRRMLAPSVPRGTIRPAEPSPTPVCSAAAAATAAAAARTAWSYFEATAEPLLAAAGSGAVPPGALLRLLTDVSYEHGRDLSPSFLGQLLHATGLEAERSARLFASLRKGRGGPNPRPAGPPPPTAGAASADSGALQHPNRYLAHPPSDLQGPRGPHHFSAQQHHHQPGTANAAAAAAAAAAAVAATAAAAVTWSPGDAAAAAAALARLMCRESYVPLPVLRRVVAAVVSGAPYMRPGELLTALGALGDLKIPRLTPAAADTVLGVLDGQLGNVRPQVLPLLLRSLARVRLRPAPGWMVSYTSRTAMYVHKYDLRQVAQLLWAYGQLIPGAPYSKMYFRPPRELVRALLRRCLGCFQPAPNHPSRRQRFRFLPPVNDQRPPTVNRRRLWLGTPPTPAAPTSGSATGGSPLDSGAGVRIGAVLYGSRVSEVSYHYRTLRPVDLAEALFGLAGLEARPSGGWLRAMYRWSDPLLPSFKARELSMLLFGLARLEAHPPKPWIRRAIRCVVVQLSYATGPDAAYACFGLARLAPEMVPGGLVEGVGARVPELLRRGAREAARRAGPLRTPSPHTASPTPPISPTSPTSRSAAAAAPDTASRPGRGRGMAPGANARWVGSPPSVSAPAAPHSPLPPPRRQPHHQPLPPATWADFLVSSYKDLRDSVRAARPRPRPQPRAAPVAPPAPRQGGAASHHPPRRHSSSAAEQVPAVPPVLGHLPEPTSQREGIAGAAAVAPAHGSANRGEGAGDEGLAGAGQSRGARKGGASGDTTAGSGDGGGEGGGRGEGGAGRGEGRGGGVVRINAAGCKAGVLVVRWPWRRTPYVSY